jgi:two-component system sensor histidine kinase KdpD
MRAHAISGPWPAGERLMVAVSSSPSSQRLVRAAARIAERLHARWFAVYVETLAHERLSEAARDQIADTLRLAEQLGAEALTVSGADPAEALMAAANERNVTRMVVGQSRQSRFEEWLRGSLVSRILRLAGPIEIHVLPDLEAVAKAKAATSDEPVAALPVNLMPYIWSSLLVAAATGIAHLGILVSSNSVVALFYIAAVMASALSFGRWPSLFAAIASTLAYNFFFIPPLYKFTVADPANIVTLLVFLGVAVFLSGLAARLRLLAEAARRRAGDASALYSFARKLAGVTALDDLLWAIAYQLASMLKARVVLLLPDETGHLDIRAGYPPDDTLSEAERAAAQWCWEQGRPAGRGADTLPGAERLFLPMKTASGSAAVIGIERKGAERTLNADERRLVDALCDQAAIAIERVRLADEVAEASVVAESERMRSLLFNSISHDLRTPLASILGAATSLRQDHDRLPAAAREDLLDTVQEESERLNRFVGNLLDMTRLEAGVLQPKRAWIDIRDIVGSALRRTRTLLARHTVRVEAEPALPPMNLDATLIEQVVVNLLDNAQKYSDAGSEIVVRLAQAEDKLLIDVIDQGLGIPESERDLIFDKFYRVRAGDRRQAGTGLGLSICKGFVVAHGGSIKALPAPEGEGAMIRVCLPVDPAGPPLPPEQDGENG